MKTIGLDVGFGFVKATSGGADVCFPAVVGRGRVPRFRTKLSDDNGQKMVIDIGKQSFFVGDYALAQAKHVWDTKDRERVHTKEFTILVQSALARVIGNDPQATVVAGLPAAHFSEKTRKQVESILTGSHLVKMHDRKAKHFMVMSAKIVVQHFGILCDYLLNKNGSWVNAKTRDLALKGTVGVLDVGRFTTGLILFDKLEYVEPRSSSIDVGMSAIHEQLALAIEEKYGRNMNLYDTDKAMVHGFVNIEGKERKLGKLADPHVADLAETIASEATSLWGNAKGLDLILIGGGGASTVGTLIAKRYPHAKVVPNGTMSNAWGFRKLGIHGRK